MPNPDPELEAFRNMDSWERRRLDHAERRRFEQLDRHRANYPPKLCFQDRFHPGGISSWELVQTALQNGLHPDTLWTREDIFDSHSCNDLLFDRGWRCCNTPLHLAIQMYDYESARIILRHGGRPDVYNGAGRTAIHEAIHIQSLEGIQFLVQHGADPDKAAEDGLRPLHMALHDGDDELFFALLDLGASLDAATYAQWSIADLALLASERVILARLMSDEYKKLPTPLLHSSKATQQPELLMVSAKKMVTVVSSNRILPENDLYETYHSILSAIKIHHIQGWNITTVDYLIQDLMRNLHKVAKIPRLALHSRLCSSCLEFQSLVLRSCRRRAAWDHRIGLQIHHSKQDLDNCAVSGCELCCMAAETLYGPIDHRFGWNHADEKTQHLELLPVSLDLRVDPFEEPIIGPRTPGIITMSLGKSRAVSFKLTAFETRFAVDENSSVGGCDDSNTGSAKSMNVARQWLQTCKNEPGHSQCREAYGISPGAYSTLPTRVINVGSEDKEPFLFEGNGRQAPYCILSYCWGRPGNAVTTKNNLSNHLQRIPLSSLPMFIRQAILTTRYLGYEYIWIDALCIVQDDVDDWAREASTMHELYSQADLTITSLTASDSGDSLFTSRPNRMMRPVPLNLCLPKRDRPKFKEGTVFELAAYPNVKENIKMDAPIHQRAWILQEQLMSTRVLYFDAGFLHWECLHGYYFEQDPSGRLGRGMKHCNIVEKRRDAKLVLKRSPKRIQTLGKNSRPIQLWQSQVEEFTRRKLTKASDRIPAFLAISKVLCKVAGDHFIGGIWTGNHLLQTLCWNLKQTNNTDPTGPTWTWASRSGEVSYGLLRHSGSLVPTASVVSCDVGADTSHSTIFGSITLKGFFRACRAGSRPAAIFDHILGSAGPLYIFDIIELRKETARKETAPSVATQARSSYYPEVQPLMAPEFDAIVSLLLKPVNDNEDFKTASVFHRVGIYRRDFDREYCAGFSPGQPRSVTEFETDRVVTIV